MLAVGLEAAEVSPYLEKYNGKVVVACHNSPSSTTLSGDADVIKELKAIFDSTHVFARSLKTGGKAYHSHHMEEAVCNYGSYLQFATKTTIHDLSRVPSCQMISSITGSALNEEILDSTYWTNNLVKPVLFNQADQKMMDLNRSINTIIEIGPHSTLSAPIRQICVNKGLTKMSYFPTLLRNKDEGTQLLNLAGNLWAKDCPIYVGSVTKVDSTAQDGPIKGTEGSLLVDLPTYKWTYKNKLWLESRQSRDHRAQTHPRHDILGRRVHGLSDSEPVWRNILRHKGLPWLKHHSVSISTPFFCLIF
jgi:acyl transferase domain-containing protein